jgi:hypothetical protein
MAFRQPTYHAPQRIYTNTTTADDIQAQTSPLESQPQHLADSQEWILFSPDVASTTDRTYTTSTAQTRTAGRSRISDFGSLDTAARSYEYDEGSAVLEEELEEEDGELDSLDSHLHEFRTEPSVYRQQGGGEASGTVLPTHDGLGSFRLDSGMGEEVQEHLYGFEQFNPRRVKRRRESMELTPLLEMESERAAEAERTRRIEEWSVEQSRLLVDEIQRETRRRKQSLSSERRVMVVDQEQEDLATLSNVSEQAPEEENESFWNRITRRVIRDLMGIDDDLLSIIFGESLPEDDDFSTTPPANGPLDAKPSIIPANQYDESSWEYRLLERIARELGILVNQLSDHPGAFSTYLHSQETPLPYAGLPVIPETTRPVDIQAPTSPTDPQFLPTIQTTTQPLSIPISSTSLAPSPLDADSTPRQSNLLSREEWERDLDIKMVFRYLRSRFTFRFHPSSTPLSSTINFTTSGTSHLATASTADTAARAARVRQHHPLVTSNKQRRKSIERRTWKPSMPSGGISAGVGGAIGGGLIRRGSSSCASQVSKRHTWNSGSSRHYWDFGAGQGGSVGSESLIASTGGMGSWGEV